MPKALKTDIPPAQIPAFKTSSQYSKEVSTPGDIFTEELGRAQDESKLETVEDEIGRATGEVLQKRAELINAQAPDIAALQKKRAELESEIGSVKDEQFKKIFRLQDVAEKAIDRDRYFSNIGTGEKALLGFAALFSGVNNALKGQPNQVLAGIDRSIEEDVKAQMLEHETAAKNAERRQSIYGFYRQAGLSSLQAHDAALASIYDRLEKQFSELPNLATQSARPLNLLAVERARLQARLKSNFDWAKVKASMGASTRVSSGSSQVPLLPAGEGGELAGYKEKLENPFEQAIVGTSAKAREVEAAIKGLDGDKLKNLSGSPLLNYIETKLGQGAGWLFAKDRAVFQSKMQGLLYALAREGTGPGVITEDEVKRFEGLIPSASDSIRNRAALLNDILQTWKTSAATKADAYPDSLYRNVPVRNAMNSLKSSALRLESLFQKIDPAYRDRARDYGLGGKDPKDTKF